MSHFGDLLGGGSNPPKPPAPVKPEPDVIKGDSDSGQVDFKDLSKLELEEYGRTIGIELDRRHSKKKLVQELEDALKNQE